MLPIPNGKRYFRCFPGLAGRGATMAQPWGRARRDVTEWTEVAWPQIHYAGSRGPTEWPAALLVAEVSVLFNRTHDGRRSHRRFL